MMQLIGHSERAAAEVLVGRDRERQRILSFVATAATDGGALVVIGDPGVGETALLGVAAEARSAEGPRGVWAAGGEFESRLGFSGLNQFLFPFPDELALLGDVHRP